jgi:hypothetical protein
MTHWLDQVFSNQFFALIVAPLIAVVLGAWLIVDFLRTRRIDKNGEPLNVWYLRNLIYPDSPLYRYFVWQRELPAITLLFFLFLIIAGIGALFVYVEFFNPSH